MILYLDTSSLVKLYVEEPGSEDVRGLVDQAAVVATSVVAYPEARAALARRRRERSLTASGFRRARAAFEEDWPRLLTLDVSGALARGAGDLAERHRLRGFDALHLASYLGVVGEFPEEDVRFSSADRTLMRAARGLRPAKRRPRGA
ncbi:MAG TPA: type II toxin-antitoxin system VapC family toxin [Vicinamibacteria bacterium]|nr:type II toxin-antitoxin system VapC family toxin [Vicinamibacteria bacterium]